MTKKSIEAEKKMKYVCITPAVEEILRRERLHGKAALGFEREVASAIRILQEQKDRDRSQSF